LREQWRGAEIGAAGGPWGALFGSILGGIGGTEFIKAVQNSPPMTGPTAIYVAEH